MRKVQASYAVLALVNGIKIDKHATPDAYIVHNDKLAGDLQAQQDAQEKARQEIVANQAAADAWRDGFTPSPKVLAQQQYPVLSHFSTWDQKGMTWSDKQVNVSHETAYQGDAPTDYTVEPTPEAELHNTGAGSLVQKQGVPDSYTEHNDKLSADIKAAHTAAEANRQATVDAQEAADAWRKGFTPSPKVLAQQQYPVLSHFTTWDQKAMTWSDKQVNVSHETAYQGDAPTDYTVEPTAEADLHNSGSLVQRSKLIYPVKDSHSYISPYSQRDHSFTDGQHDVSDEVKWVDNTKTLHADYVEQLDPSAEYHLRDGRTGVPTPDTTATTTASLVQKRGVPDSYIVNNDALAASIKKQHTDAENHRQDMVDNQEASDQWRKGWTPSSGPVLRLSQNQDPTDYDNYATHSGNLGASIKKQHTQAEADRQAAVDAQEAADAWRAGFTPSPRLVQRSNPADHDTYGTRSGNLGTEIKNQHTAAEASRQAAVDAQEAADAWRKGSTPNSGPVLSLVQSREIPDGYTYNSGVLSASLAKTQKEAEDLRQAAVDKQAAADAWRDGWTANTGAVFPYGLVQSGAIPDGYTFNNNVLSDSIKKTHTDAETARQAAVDRQAAADAWRDGWTANTGPVYPYGLVQSRAIPDGYTYNNNILSDSIKKAHTDAETARQAAVDRQAAADAWRDGWTANTGPVYPYGLVQSRAIPDGYTYNNGILSASIHKTHTDAETARQAAVDRQAAADAWRDGWTPNSGPVYPYGLLAQGNPGPNPTDYDLHFKTLNDKINTHNKIWFDEHNAGVANQAAVDAWRDGSTANAGPEIPYSF